MCRLSWVTVRARMQAARERMTMVSELGGSVGRSPRLHTALCVLFPGNRVGNPSWTQLGHTNRALGQPSAAPEHSSALLQSSELLGVTAPELTAEAPPSSLPAPPTTRRPHQHSLCPRFAAALMAPREGPHGTVNTLKAEFEVACRQTDIHWLQGWLGWDPAGV